MLMMIRQPLIYIVIVILQQYKGVIAVVPYPCPSIIDESTVADMCMSSSATEEIHSGSFKVDSVVLRIMTQQDNCICRVTIDNQIEPVHVGLRKYDGFTSSAPVTIDCGLAVDITHIPEMSTGNIIAPIECIENVNFRSLPLFENSTLEFKSRIIQGSFIRGYCMRITRDSFTDPSQVLRIDCDVSTTIEQTTLSDTTTVTSDNVEYSSKTTITSPEETDSLQSTTKRTKKDTIANDQITDINTTAYIAVTVFSSTVAIILLVFSVVTCIRYKSLQRNVNRTNGNVNNTNQVEYNRHYCDLTNNIPNVPGQEYDIIDSNYNTIAVDRPQPSNNIVCMGGEYINIEPDGHLTPNINCGLEPILQ